MFLDAEKLILFTGRVRPTAQARYLRAHGVPHTINAAGKPVVLVEEVERRLRAGRQRKAPASSPDFSALD
jgi:hypothetical protein